MSRVACIDIGTYTVRLAIADVENARVIRMAKQSTICDLGEGVDATGQLADAAVERVLACVDTYMALTAQARPTALACTLTSAARDAENCTQLTQALEMRGIHPQVISGEMEGTLTFLGIAQDFRGQRIATADPGGGSTELVIGMLGDDGKLEVEWLHSVPVGCRRITDRFFSNGMPPASEELEAARVYCRETFNAAYADRPGEPPATLVCVGGTATSLVAVGEGMETYNPARVHLAQLSRSRIDELVGRLSTLTLEEMMHLPGLQAKRAPVILGGAIAISELVRLFNVDELTVSESDLLFGLALDTAAGLESL